MEEDVFSNENYDGGGCVDIGFVLRKQLTEHIEAVADATKEKLDKNNKVERARAELEYETNTLFENAQNDEERWEINKIRIQYGITPVAYGKVYIPDATFYQLCKQTLQCDKVDTGGELHDALRTRHPREWAKKQHAHITGMTEYKDILSRTAVPKKQWGIVLPVERTPLTTIKHLERLAQKDKHIQETEQRMSTTAETLEAVKYELKLIRLQMRGFSLDLEAMKRGFLTSTDTESKYQVLMSCGDDAGHIPDSDIADILGVSTKTIQRIRKKLSSHES